MLDIRRHSESIKNLIDTRKLCRQNKQKPSSYNGPSRFFVLRPYRNSRKTKIKDRALVSAHRRFASTPLLRQSMASYPSTFFAFRVATVRENSNSKPNSVVYKQKTLLLYTSPYRCLGYAIFNCCYCYPHQQTTYK